MESALTTLQIFYANHWPEVVPLMAARLAGCDRLVTEDAPSAEFAPMLAGDLSLDDYLAANDTEFPEFGRRLGRVWQRLHRKGVAVRPVEPFVEELLAIHHFLADGGTPTDIPAGTRRRAVYEAERDATGALLDFYQTAADGSFAEVLAAIRRFARADARRFVLRDRLRAEAILAELPAKGRVAVEAGQIHLALGRDLRRLRPAGIRVETVFLMTEIAARLGRRRHLYPPGDLLTLLYVFHPRLETARHERLAARALVYAKVTAKMERVPDDGDFPQTRDDLHTLALVERLPLVMCRELFRKMRRAGVSRARRILFESLQNGSRRLEGPAFEARPPLPE